jgi:hypothetical protein
LPVGYRKGLPVEGGVRGRALREVLRKSDGAVGRKLGHDLVAIDVELRRAGVCLAGVVGDSAWASHLTSGDRPGAVLPRPGNRCFAGACLTLVRDGAIVFEAAWEVSNGSG